MGPCLTNSRTVQTSDKEIQQMCHNYFHKLMLKDAGTLDLYDRNVGKHIRHVTDESIAKNIMKLSIGKNGLGDEQVGGILKMKWPRLSILQMQMNKITDKSIKAIASVSTITKLNLSGNKIGFQGCKQLKSMKQLRHLYVQGCNLTNECLEQIAKIKLVELDISNNKVSKEAIKKLNHLHKLYLSSIGINNNHNLLQQLSKLQHIQSLDISSNQITNEGLNAYIHNNKHSHSIKQLTIYNNNITIIQNIHKLTQLQLLNISQNTIGDEGCKHISKLTQLHKLYIMECNITNQGIQCLSSLRQMSQLNIRYNQFNDNIFTILSSNFASTLTKLDICGNRLQDINSIQKLSLLEYLDLGQNQIKDPSPITQLTKLKVLKLNNNDIQNIDKIKELQSLEQLDLGWNRLSTIKQLSNTKSNNLKILNLQENKINNNGLQSLTHLKQLIQLNLNHNLVAEEGLKKIVKVKCNKLEKLSLQKNNIKDQYISQLLYFQNIQFLDLCGNCITNAGVQKLQKQTKGRIVHILLAGNLIQKITKNQK